MKVKIQLRRLRTQLTANRADCALNAKCIRWLDLFNAPAILPVKCHFHP